MLVTIISSTPVQAVMPSSRTIGMSISMITAKPSALVSSATAPGTNSVQNAVRAAATASAPATTSRRQALVICTACETPIENTRNGTRIDIGSMPKPISGSTPISQSTGSSATTVAAAVSRSERE